MPPSSMLWISIVLLILSVFLSDTYSKHNCCICCIVLLSGSGSKIHKYTSFDSVSDFNTATLPSGVMVHFARMLNSFFGSFSLSVI